MGIKAMNNDEEALFCRRKRQLFFYCCGTAVAIIIILALICVILGVTVFKIRDPKVTVNSVALSHLNMEIRGLNLELNVTLDMNLSVKNPNKASFKFGNSTVQLYYHGTNCGEALIPGGKVDAERTVKMNTTVIIMGHRFMSDSHLFGDGLSGVFPLTSWTAVSGRVNFFKVYKHHAVSYSHCNLSIIVANRTIQREACSYTLKI